MNNKKLWKPSTERTWGFKELYRDTEGNFHPWENNDEVYYSPEGIPCKAPSQEVENDTILITMAFLKRFRSDLKEVQGEWAFSQVRISVEKFTSSFRSL